MIIGIPDNEAPSTASFCFLSGDQLVLPSKLIKTEEQSSSEKHECTLWFESTYQMNNDMWWWSKRCSPLTGVGSKFDI
ncbi:unnamed protein product [Ambrosiozyma monospora]|nr:unnamed protein product [Ambrosiozyma monospora]